MLKPLNLSLNELKYLLDEKAEQYNRPEFIETDPIQIPRLFDYQQDAEIAGFITATISWGNRKSIINNAHKFLKIIGNSPYDFVMEYNQNWEKTTDKFVHRTFNGVDLAQFIYALQAMYTSCQTMEEAFLKHHLDGEDYLAAIDKFRNEFTRSFIDKRSLKHVSSPLAGSAAKRINMFLRWMVRKDNKGVDMGWWKNASPALLSCPLDVHTGNVARELGLIQRKQNDRKALEELDKVLRKFNSADPVLYDFALFGIGIFEKMENFLKTEK
ncbi:MAG: TIGR02757 family protein [Flavobacteriales bacterium]